MTRNTCLLTQGAILNLPAGMAETVAAKTDFTTTLPRTMVTTMTLRLGTLQAADECSLHRESLRPLLSIKAEVRLTRGLSSEPTKAAISKTSGMAYILRRAKIRCLENSSAFFLRLLFTISCLVEVRVTVDSWVPVVDPG